MFILGAGAATPTTELSDSFLASLGLSLTEKGKGIIARAGVTSRYTSLPLEYIKETKNRDVLAARSIATSSPTALGVEAARQAIARAGITAEQVGLVLADTATPNQTCPSEAQRICGALGLKVPAYDIVAGDATLSFYVELLSSWKPERLPDYVLCVSTNTPTQHVLFENDALPAYLYGDAASAVVLSPRVTGKFSVSSSFARRRGAFKPISTVGYHVSTDVSAGLAEDVVVAAVQEGLSQASGEARSVVIAPELYAADVVHNAPKLGVENVRIVSSSRTTGYSLGASSGVALSSEWDSVPAGKHIAVLHVGDGMVAGSIIVASGA